MSLYTRALAVRAAENALNDAAAVTNALRQELNDLVNSGEITTEEWYDRWRAVGRTPEEYLAADRLDAAYEDLCPGFLEKDHDELLAWAVTAIIEMGEH